MEPNDYATRWRQAAPRPSGARGKIRAALRHSLLSASSFINRSLDNTFLRCLYCHYVFDDQRVDFERLILELVRLGEFVDTDSCVQMLRGERAIDNRYFHLSFDDGFRNNFTNALPILRKHDIPAIFFVPSSRVEANWTDTANWLSTTLYNGVIETLRWDDLRKIISYGYEIGSHTKTHARLASISNNKAAMEDEILGSKKELEDKLNTQCKYLSWPFGRTTDTDAASLAAVRKAGYDACFGGYRGTIRVRSTDVFNIPRHHFEVQWPIAHSKYFARGNMERGR